MPASAQAIFPATKNNVVGLGVDLKRASFSYSNPDISIGNGSAPQSLTLVRTHNSQFATYAGTFGYGTTTNFDIKLYETVEAGQTVAVYLNGFSAQKYTLSGSTYVTQAADGSTLVKTAIPGTGTYYYQQTQRNGDTAVLLPGTPCTTAFGICYYAARIVARSTGGYRLFYDYGAGRLRLRSVVSDYGRALFVTYPSTSEWKASAVFAVNLASTYCGAYCTSSTGQPTVTYGYTGDVLTAKTDTLGKTTSFAYDGSNRLQTIRQASNSSVDFLATSYDASGRVASQVWNGKTWTYGFTLSGSEVTQATVTDPLANTTTTHFGTLPAPDTITDASGNVTQLHYDGYNRLDRRTHPNNIVEAFTLDDRGNVTAVTTTPDPSVSPAPMTRVVQFGFSASPCANQITCNLPSSMTNSKGTTTFDYDSTTGNITKVTSPSPKPGDPQPQTRYEYATRQAYIKDSSGNPTIYIDNSSSGAGNQILVTVPVLTKVARCSSSGPTTCPGAADEIVSTFGYGATSGLNNLDLVGSVEDATGSALASTFSYDAVGNVQTVLGPYSGSTDLTINQYDSERRLVQVTSPNPGASGVPVTVIDYDDDGRPIRQAQQRASAWLVSCTRYNAAGLAVRAWGAAETSSSGSCPAEGDPVAVTDYGYDDAGRPNAITQRLTAAQGGDRLSTREYYPNGWLKKVHVAVGSTVESTYQTFTYTGDGLPQTLRDGRGNLTTYEYDGFDELRKLRYPDVANGSVSSTTDFEAFDYDQNRNLTSHTQRGGAVIGYTYDALDRLTFKDVPEGDRDVTYVYDLLDRPLSATLPGTNAGLSVSWTYDKLDRTLSETELGRTTNYTYEPTGVWDRIQWPGSGLTVQRNYDVLGRMTSVAQVGAATPLATYGYDQLSRRQTASNGNGTSSTWNYDAQSRLQSLGTGIGGAGYAVAFSYGYNQVGQLSGRVRDADAYAWTNNYNVNRGYTTNALDQYTQAGGRPLGYDVRGNLASYGAQGYAHDSENRLVAASGPSAATLAYDAVDRLVRTSSGGSATELLYDGDALIAEYDPASGGVLRRYVHGPGVDEPVVWYEGGGLGDPRWLHGDERGSIIAGSNASGAGLFINSYGPFGEPGLTQTGRFGYTGQARIPEIGLYNYKARAYSPQLGRFLETDPIGTQDDTNLYAYTSNDPINLTDPSGLDASAIFSSQPLTIGNLNLQIVGYGPNDILVRGYYSTAWYASLINATVGPGTLYDRTIVQPFYGTLNALASSPLGDPGLYMAAEQSGVPGVMQAGGVGYAVSRGLQTLAALTRSVRAAESLQQIMAPAGQLIGTVAKGATPNIRSISNAEFQSLQTRLFQAGARPVASPNGYPGTWYRLSSGGEFGVRQSPKSGLTIDVGPHPGLPQGLKVHNNGN